MSIILIGYMGSGKSAVGKKLSEVLSYDYLDLDHYIQREEGETIAAIFKGKGELYFRKIESRSLRKVLANNTAVISLGGGTPCYGHNMDLIKNTKNASSVYLKTSIPILVERLFPEKNQRPLISHLKNEEELNEFIGKHIFERAPYYNQSDVIVNTDDKTIEEVVETIVLKLF